MPDGSDAAYMDMALVLAGRALGCAWPNPAVGCVLVRDGQVVGRGWTGTGGRPHAEDEALRQAGPAAAGATAYVTLEPCSHHGRTPPCADALAAAGVSRVVVALGDPDRRVDGRGIAALRAAGITVTVGVGEAAAAELNAGFLLRVRQGRPLVTLKLATSLDGRIATREGESRWITGDSARARGHLMRAQHDAIMIGSGTATFDDPELTCRLPGLDDRSPVRIVVDGSLRLPLTSRLARTAATVPTWLITREEADRDRQEAFVDCGIEVMAVEAGIGGEPDLHEALQVLGDRGVTRILVEGGSRLAASLLQADLVDRLHWFRAPCLIGGDGVPAVAALGLDRLAASPRFRRLSVEPLGEDLLETFARPS